MYLRVLKRQKRLRTSFGQHLQRDLGNKFQVKQLHSRHRNILEDRGIHDSREKVYWQCGKWERKGTYHAAGSRTGCSTGPGRGCSVLLAWTSALARSPPAPRSSGSGSCGWPRGGTCACARRAARRTGWWGRRGTCRAACSPPPSGSRGWTRCPAPAEGSGVSGVRISQSKTLYRVSN